VKPPAAKSPYRILFLPAWYPNRHDRQFANFIERQARALAGHVDISVLYPCPDRTMIGKARQVEVSDESGVKVIRIYYYAGNHALIKAFRYARTVLSGYNIVKKQAGRPDLVHAHILTRAGIMARLIRMFGGIPYVISEHWSRYLPEHNTYRGAARKMLTRWAVRKAAALIAVSETLEEAMRVKGIRHERFHVVPNVIDTNLFRPGVKTISGQKKRMVHVSSFEDRSKNIAGILQAVKALSVKRSDFTCHLVGDGPDRKRLEKLASDLGIKDRQVFFEGILEGEDLVDAYRKADFLVMFSRYETFQMVLVESLACGVPVLASSIPASRGLVGDDRGRMVPPGDEEALVRGMEYMLDHHHEFDGERMRAYVVNHFSPDEVGKRIHEIYREILG
jgi:glycosyltransferase involved in cell wall biosynthesis